MSKVYDVINWITDEVLETTSTREEAEYALAEYIDVWKSIEIVERTNASI